MIDDLRRECTGLAFRSWLAPALLEVRDMDPSVVLALVLLVPLLLLAFTARTRFSWLSGTLVLVAACAIFATIKPVSGDVGGIDALGDGLATIAAVGLSIFGLVLFVVGCLLGPKRERRQPSTLPVATAVAGVDKPR